MKWVTRLYMLMAEMGYAIGLHWVTWLGYMIMHFKSWNEWLKWVTWLYMLMAEIGYVIGLHWVTWLCIKGWNELYDYAWLHDWVTRLCMLMDENNLLY